MYSTHITYCRETYVDDQAAVVYHFAYRLAFKLTTSTGSQAQRDRASCLVIIVVLRRIYMIIYINVIPLS